MKTVYIKIDGMHCKSCENKIKNTVKKIKNVNNLSISKSVLTIKYSNEVDIDNIIDVINELGYYTNKDMIFYNIDDIKNKIKLWEFIVITFSILLVFLLIERLFNYNIFNIIPVIDNKYSIPYLFVIGFFTSIHCISMCGAINLLASTSSKPSLKKPLFYNFGRLVSYTLIGGIFGLIGSFVKFNYIISGIIIVFAAVIMMVMALNMLNIFNIDFYKFKSKIKVSNKSPFILGLLNGLMPCGPLQSIQLYALSTSSFILGSLSMFFFALGTIPLMLLIGIIVNFLSFKRRKIINKISAVLILILSFVMLNRGLLSLGLDVSDIFKEDYSSYIKAKIVDGVQYVEFDLTFWGYQDIVIQKDIPVVMIINANEKSLNGCNNGIKFAQFGFSKKLYPGKNKIEFTIDKTGKFYYTCWMDMYKNNIVVIDDISYFEE